jgi:spermidine synthase
MGAAIAISGFAAMGMEIAWFRFLPGIYMATRFTFSILLAVLLVGMCLGSTVGGYISKRFRDMELVYICGQFLFAFSVLVGLFFSIYTRRFYFAEELMRSGRPAIPVRLFDYLNVTAAALKTILLPAVFMGLAYPSVNAVVQTKIAKVGTRAGAIYLWNCTGDIAGSLITGFLFLPYLGIQLSVTLLVICAAMATVPILLSSRQAVRSWMFRVSLIAFLALSAFWLSKPPSYLLRSAMSLL